MKFKFINDEFFLSSIGLGTMGIGEYFKKDESRDGFFINIIKKGLEQEMFIDTAEIYANGHSEELIGKSIENFRDFVILATKVSPENLGYQNVIKSCENSLSRFNTNYIDLYQIHWPNPTISLEETMLAMKHLLEAGLIKNIGVCNLSLLELVDVNSIADKFGLKIASNQVEYNLIDRTIEEDLISYCEENSIMIIGYSPLKWNKYLGKDKIKTLEDIAKKYNKTITQIILNFLISKPFVITIVKTESIDHIIENAKSSDFELEKQDIELIDKAFKSSVIEIPMGEIKVDNTGIDNFVPHPKDLAIYYRNNLDNLKMKPIKVKRINDDKYRYELIEGKVKYWAWNYAFNKTKQIIALVLN